MRGRRPRPLALAPEDVDILWLIASSRSRPWLWSAPASGFPLSLYNYL
jgi:hypothetical protein